MCILLPVHLGPFLLIKSTRCFMKINLIGSPPIERNLGRDVIVRYLGPLPLGYLHPWVSVTIFWSLLRDWWSTSQVCTLNRPLDKVIPSRSRGSTSLYWTGIESFFLTVKIPLKFLRSSNEGVYLRVFSVGERRAFETLCGIFGFLEKNEVIMQYTGVWRIPKSLYLRVTIWIK